MFHFEFNCETLDGTWIRCKRCESDWWLISNRDPRFSWLAEFFMWIHRHQEGRHELHE